MPDIKHALVADGDPLVGAADWNDPHVIEDASIGFAKLVGAAASTHSHAGEDITSGTVADARVASTITRDSEAAAAYSAIGHDHDGTPEAKLAQANTHESPDTDTATTALHHTLGTGANQAAAGNHNHTSLSAQSAALDMNSHKINNVTDPTSNQDAATKKYVDDSVAAGVSFGTPANTYGTPAAGAASTAIRTDAVLPLPPISVLSATMNTTSTTLGTTYNTDIGGLSLSCPAGTYIFVTSLLFNAVGGNRSLYARVWNGTTDYDEFEGSCLSGFRQQITHISIPVVLGSTTTVKVSGGADAGASNTISRNGGNSTTNTPTSLIAIRIA